VWYSLFPVSESLYASLLVAGMYFLVQARREQSHRYAVCAGLVLGLLLFVRGNAMLLVPIGVLLLLVSAALDPDVRFRVQRTFSATLLASLAIGWTYGVHFTGDYFHKQLDGMVPGALYRAAVRYHLVEAGARLAVALLVAFGVVFALAALVRRLSSRMRGESTEPYRWVAGGVVIAFAVALTLLDRGGLVDALQRWNLVIVAFATGGVAVLVVRAGRAIDGIVALALLSSVGAYVALYADRLPEARDAPYYLYWDRYLFSEVMPVALALAAISATALFMWLSSAGEQPARAYVVAAIVGSVIVVPLGDETLRVTRHQLYGRAYATLDALDAATRSEGRGAIVYSGTAVMPPGWYFNGTARSFGLPLRETFDRTVLGQAFQPSKPDKIYDTEQARTLLGETGRDGGYLISYRTPGTEAPPDDSYSRRVATIEYRYAVLPRRVDRTEETFTFGTVQLDVYVVSVNEPLRG
jgi:hypothetical protein